MVWVVAAGVITGSVLLACAVALADSVRERGQAQQARRRLARASGAGALPGRGVAGGTGAVQHADWVLGDPKLAAQLGSALSQLSRGLSASQVAPPDLDIVLAGYDRIILRLIRPVPVPQFPPWRAEAGDQTGRSWVVDVADLPPGEPGPSPYPALAVVGRSHGWTVLADLAQVPGHIVLTGDPRQVPRAFGEMAFGLATNPWSRELRIIMGGVDGNLAVPEPERVARFASVDEAVAFADRLAGQPSAGPLALLLGQPPGQPQQLARFAADPRRCAVVAAPAGMTPASWVFEAGADGRLTLGPTGPVVDPITGPVAGPAPEPAPAAGGTGDWWQPGPVEVRTLGPLEVNAPGAVDSQHGPVLATLAAMAAVHPAGVPAPIFGELLPHPGAASVATRQLHDWLGSDGTGLPRLCARHGAWRLSPDVRVDWLVFRELVGNGVADPEEERRRLATALALIRGELLAGVRFGPQAQQLLRDDIAEIQAMVVRAVHRDAELARAAGDLARAEWAMRQGLVLLPRAQRLWRLLLQFQAEHHQEAVGPTVERMKAVLAGAKLDTETRKLVSRLEKAAARRR
jgi:hypothetical protein